jgi:hypothetical protein
MCMYLLHLAFVHAVVGVNFQPSRDSSRLAKEEDRLLDLYLSLNLTLSRDRHTAS